MEQLKALKGIGVLLAVLVILFAVLMAAGVVPASQGWVGGLIAALGVAVALS